MIWSPQKVVIYSHRGITSFWKLLSMLSLIQFIMNPEGVLGLRKGENSMGRIKNLKRLFSTACTSGFVISCVVAMESAHGIHQIGSQESPLEDKKPQPVVKSLRLACAYRVDATNGQQVSISTATS